MKLKKELIKNILLLKDYTKSKYLPEYTLNLKNGQQELLLFGCQHSFNSSDKKFNKIEKLFEKFCQNKKNVEVALENLIPLKGNTKEELIKKYDATGFVSHLAHENKIKVFCPEPSQQQLLDFMIARGCQKTDIIGWILLNIFSSKKELNKNDSKQIISILEQSKKQLKIKGNILNQVIKKINLVAGTEILMFKNSQFYCKKPAFKTIYNLQKPLSDKTIFNRIGGEINLARDYFIAEQILARLKKRKNVFSVFGTYHVVAQEKIYRKFFKKKNEV